MITFPKLPITGGENGDFRPVEEEASSDVPSREAETDSGDRAEDIEDALSDTSQTRQPISETDSDGLADGGSTVKR